MIAKAAKGFSVLMVVRVISRVVDFILNILVLRKIDPQIYGLTTHLGLLSNFSLFYLKVCLKQAYQRRITVDKTNQDVTLVSARNMMIFGEGATIFITPLITYLIAYFYGDLHPDFEYSCLLHAIAVIIEGYTEPLAVVFILNFNYTVPAQAETIAVFVKTFALYVLVESQVPALIAFGYAQILFSVVCILILLFHYLKNHSFIDSIIPHAITQGTYIQQEMKTMGAQFTLMAMMKFLLQELEKIVIVTFRKNDVKVSAEFSLVSHIGAFVPRFIYSPIEEVSFNLFSKLSSEQSDREKEEQEQEESSTLIREKASKKESFATQTAKALKQQQDYLYKILKIMNAFGLGFVLAGTMMSEGFLVYVYGPQWGTQTCIIAFQTFCFYEWCMGLNGITEAFVNGNLKKHEMNSYRFYLLIITGIYILCSLILVNFGAAGIILANCISMITRIILSFSIIKRKLHGDSWLKALQNLGSTFPSPLVFIAYAVGAILTFYINPVRDYLTYFYYLAYFGFVFLASIYSLKRDIRELYENK